MIFGKQVSKAVVNPGQTKEYEVVFSYSWWVEYQPVQPIQNEAESPLNGQRTVTSRGHHSEFAVKFHLHKNSNPTGAWQTLYSLLNKKFWLYLHTDDGTNVVRDKDGEPVFFYVSGWDQRVLNTVEVHDLLTINIRSLSPTDWQKTLDEYTYETADETTTGGYGYDSGYDYGTQL